MQYENRTRDSGITTRGFATKLTAPYRNTLDLQPTCSDQPTFNLHRSCVQFRMFLYGKLIAGRTRTCMWRLFPLAPIMGLCLPFHHREFLRLITPQYGCYLQITLTILKHTQLSALDSLLLLGACSNVLQYGATRRIRTSHPCVRSTVLYPNELWSLFKYD